jgi:hypothetical protein
MRLDTENQEQESDQRHTEGKDQEGGKHRLCGLLRWDEVAGAGDQREAQRPDDLAKPVRRLAEPRIEKSNTKTADTRMKMVQ